MAHKIEHQLSLYSKRKTINSTIHSILKHKQSGTLTSTLNAKSTASILKVQRIAQFNVQKISMDLTSFTQSAQPSIVNLTFAKWLNK